MRDTGSGVARVAFLGSKKGRDKGKEGLKRCGARWVSMELTRGRVLWAPVMVSVDMM